VKCKDRSRGSITGKYSRRVKKEIWDEMRAVGLDRNIVQRGNAILVCM
jgi:hypothetical protein